MNWWQAIILGFVQGATEFLPVSSSGHLILVRYWTGLEGDYMLFDTLLHLATLGAIAIMLFGDIKKMFKPPFRVFFLIALVSIPAVITGFLLQPLLKEYFDTPKYLWIFFFLTAALLTVTEILSKRNQKRAQGQATQEGTEPQETAEESGEKPLEKMPLKTAVAMGLMQSVAILPGLSRSGSTIFGGVVTKGDRKSVAKFSFLMSVPIILGAVVLELYNMTKPPVDGAVVVTVPLYAYILGIVTAFGVGLFAIKLMLAVIQKANYKWFSAYLVAMGITTMICYFILGL